VSFKTLRNINNSLTLHGYEPEKRKVVK